MKQTLSFHSEITTLHMYIKLQPPEHEYCKIRIKGTFRYRSRYYLTSFCALRSKPQQRFSVKSQLAFDANFRIVRSLGDGIHAFHGDRFPIYHGSCVTQTIRSLLSGNVRILCKHLTNYFHLCYWISTTKEVSRMLHGTLCNKHGREAKAFLFDHWGFSNS